MSGNDHLGSLRNARSNIDPISNFTLLGPVELQTDAVSLITGTLPRDVLPAYLHEAAHHWCFYLPVGLALALLKMRAGRRAVRLEFRGDETPLEIASEDDWDVMDDFIRYKMADQALAPLAEGIACFAEHDALPGDAAVATDLMTALTSFLAEVRKGEDRFAVLNAALRSERAQSRYAGRKASLLMQSLDLDRGGYLAGYLFVKALWFGAIQKNGRLADSELFLSLLVSYIYADLGLVATLLDAETSDYGAGGAVVNYLGGRLMRFHATISDEWLDALEDVSRRRQLEEGLEDLDLKTSCRRFENLGTDPVLFGLGCERLGEAYDELQQAAEGDPSPVSGLAARQITVLEQRQLLVVGSLEVRVDVSVGGSVSVWGGDELVASGPGVAGTSVRRQAPGSLMICINPWRWGRYMAYVVTVDDHPVLTWFSHDPPERLKERFLGYYTDSESNMALEAEVNEAIERRLLANNAHLLLGPARKNVAKWAKTLYLNGAFQYATDLDAVGARMKATGLLGIMGSLSLVRALAWLGMNWRNYTHGKSIEDAFAEADPFHECGTDLWETVAEIARIAEEKLGEPLVVRSDGTVVCMV